MKVMKKGFLTMIRHRILGSLKSPRSKIHCCHADLKTSVRRRCFREIYLFLPHSKFLARRSFKFVLKSRFIDFDKAALGQPLFLDPCHAKQYSRFMGNDHVILKAYVCEQAIEALSLRYEVIERGHLTLKPGFLARELIHGYFPSFAREQTYIQNPCFDAAAVIN